MKTSDDRDHPWITKHIKEKALSISQEISWNYKIYQLKYQI